MLTNRIFAHFKSQQVYAASNLYTRYQSTNVHLEHVGTILPEVDTENSYSIGQTFLHKVFAYRGIIIQPWCANISEQSKYPGPYPSNSRTDITKPSSHTTETYYQALIDSRDLPSNREEAFFVTVAKTNESGETMTGIQTVLGVDYISHTDVLPYTSAEKVPIKNDLFSHFFSQNDESKQFEGTERLNKWKNINHKCLRMDKVYKETTGDIRVTAIPFFLGMKNSSSSHLIEYWWRYAIRIENLGDDPARLQERHWRIISNGSVKTVRGRGVSGKEPILNKSSPVFHYCSHMSLPSNSGTMWGTFRLEKESGEQFDARIPAFALETT